MVYPHCYRTEHSETHTTNSTYGEYYAKLQSKKIPIQPELLKLLQFIDTYRSDFVKDLKDMVQIKSVSGSLNHIDDVKAMIEFTEKWLVKLGVKYECFNMGKYEIEGKTVKVPPVILGSLGSGSDKKTLVIYGHLDVKEPNLNEWKTDPWTVTKMNKTLYGNGVASGKGPLLTWFHVISGFQDKKLELPVNIKFIIESTNQLGSIGLEDFLVTHRQDFLYNVDYIVVCESEWLGEKMPCLVYGSVGHIHFRMTVENTKSDPKKDVKKIFEKIVDNEENILIPDFNHYVEQIRPDEEKVYESIDDFNIEEYRESLPEYKKSWDKIKLLMSFWRLPSIWVDDIQECICDKKEMSKVKRDFIIKIVPRQIVDKTANHVLTYINSVCEELKLESIVKVEVIASSKPWYANFRSPNYVAASKATIQIYKDPPNMIREDKNINSVKILSRVIDKVVVLLPLGNKNINAGKPNENITLRNFYEGTKLLAAYLYQLSYLKTHHHNK